MTRKISISMLAVALLVLFSTAAAVQARPLVIGIAAGGTGGTYYPMSAAIAELISKNVEGVKNATAQVTGASFENVRLLERGYCQFSTTNAASVYAAYNAKEPFTEPLKKIRTMVWGHGSDLHIVTLADSDIKTIEDLKGKRFAVGSPGSGGEIEVRRLLETNGWTYDDIEEEFLSYGEAMNALKDGRIDAGEANAGIPVASVMDLAMTKKIRILPVPDKWVENLLKEYPIYDTFTIPGGLYKGVDEDIPTLTSPATFSTSIDVPEKVVYQTMKTIYENMDWLEENIHKSFSRWKFDPSIQRLAPLHPGAEKFYKEIGKM